VKRRPRREEASRVGREGQLRTERGLEGVYRVRTRVIAVEEREDALV